MTGSASNQRCRPGLDVVPSADRAPAPFIRHVRRDRTLARLGRREELPQRTPVATPNINAPPARVAGRGVERRGP